jgi:hypothetical protein
MLIVSVRTTDNRTYDIAIENSVVANICNTLENSSVVLEFKVSQYNYGMTQASFGFGDYTKWVEAFFIKRSVKPIHRFCVDGM